MTLSLVGVLPVSGVNLGLAMAPPVLTAEITQFELDISKLGLAIAAQLEMSLNVPNLAALAATLADIAAALAALLVPANVAALAVTMNLELVAQLGIVDAALDVATDVRAAFALGLDTGGFAAWCYSGPASGLAAAPLGISGTWSSGLVVATESLSSWGQFGVSVNTGPSGSAPAGGPGTLTSLATLTGGQILIGLVDLFARIDLFHLKLRGMKANLEQQIEVTLGLNLPDLSELLALLEQLAGQVESLLDNLVNVSVDLDAQIGWFQVRLNALLSLTASLSAQLSAGGLALWRFEGPGQLGAEIDPAVSGGIPGGTGASADIRALVIAHQDAEVWAKFAPLLGG
jgi:hypothetical protein